MRQNIIFQEINDDRVSGLSSGYNFNPLCEVVCGCEDPRMLS
jgi:hypothetical protein